jgi:hypothetical protein
VDTDQYLTVPEAQKVLLSSAMKSNHPRCVWQHQSCQRWQI